MVFYPLEGRHSCESITVNDKYIEDAETVQKIYELSKPQQLKGQEAIKEKVQLIKLLKEENLL